MNIDPVKSAVKGFVNVVLVSPAANPTGATTPTAIQEG